MSEYNGCHSYLLFCHTLLLTNMLAQQKLDIIHSLECAIEPLIADTGIKPTILLERPRDPSHGDFACNIAMQIAKPLKKNPRELAQSIIDALLEQKNSLIESTELAGPGFINIRLSKSVKQAVVKTVLEQGDQFGRGQLGTGKKVVVEFVSANPTGPLHVGHGRQGALGDALAALLEAQNYSVTREFYYNDAGVQIATLANSVQARAKGFKPGDDNWPESAYNGDYIEEIAQDFLAKKTVSASDGEPATANGDINDIDSIRHFSVTYLRNEQDIDLLAFGVKFDHYYLESSLYQDGNKMVLYGYAPPITAMTKIAS
jgi:arginyl-tRNA synthetase